MEAPRGDARLIERIARAQYRVLDRMRHRDAFRAAQEPAAATGFDGLAGHHQALLVTYRRSGEPVPTPVLFGLEDRKLYFRSDRTVGKLKRIRNEPRVLIGPCNLRGKPLGPLAEGSARIVASDEEEHAYEVLKANYRLDQRLLESTLDRLPIGIAYVEIVPERGEAESRRPA